MNFHFEREIDPLNKEEWAFYVFDSLHPPKIVLDCFRLLNRKTKRHKYEVVKCYSRLNVNRIPQEMCVQPEITDWAKEQVRKKLLEIPIVEKYER